VYAESASLLSLLFEADFYPMHARCYCWVCSVRICAEPASLLSLLSEADFCQAHDHGWYGLILHQWICVQLRATPFLFSEAKFPVIYEAKFRV
jgi:hypothetical protein